MLYFIWLKIVKKRKKSKPGVCPKLYIIHYPVPEEKTKPDEDEKECAEVLSEFISRKFTYIAE